MGEWGEELVTENKHYYRYNLYSFVDNVLKFNSESFSEICCVLHNTKLSSIKGLPNEGQLDNSGFK